MADVPPPSAPRIFLSYRRTDVPGHAGRLHDALVRHVGDEHVFMDVDKIPPGQNFAQVIDEALVGCDVLFALIGPRWLARGRFGRRRLDDPDDFVRTEIGTAIERGLVVVPVLALGAEMPSARQLPDRLAALADIQAVELSDRRWAADVRSLLTVLDGLDLAALRAARPAHARPPAAGDSKPDGERARRSGLGVGAAVAAVLLVVGGVLAATRDGATSATRAPATASPAASNTGPRCDTSYGNLSIGVVAPLSGADRVEGVGVRNAAQLAVDQANATCAVRGYRLVLAAEDDHSDVLAAEQAATRLAADQSVVGVVGATVGSTAERPLRILADAGIPVISPTSTDLFVTRGSDPVAAPKRLFPMIFRLAANDLVQGPFAARHLVQKAGRARIAVVDDSTPVGTVLADTFVQEATKLGATVVARAKVDRAATDFSKVVDRIRPGNPDAVYFGGIYPTAPRLSHQLVESGMDIPLAGANRIIDGDYVSEGGRPGDLATVAGAPPESLSYAAHFVGDYGAARFPDPCGVYGAAAFDAATIVIDALASTVDDPGWSGRTWAVAKRAVVARNVQAIDFDGASGPVSFDEFGDVVDPALTVYSPATGGRFAPVADSTGRFER